MILLWAVIGYLLGSIPFGLLLSRGLGLGDLRQIGSGNIGATNVLRTGNKGAALATLLLDGGKAALAVVLARVMAGESAAHVAGLAALVGHCFPLWLNFKGGKAVASFIGLMLTLAWPVGLAVALTWAATAWRQRISSLAALVAAATAPLWALILCGASPTALTAALAAALIFWRHKDNISRLRRGTEPRIGGS